MYVSLWLNTVRAVQIFFIERIFVFFMILFLKKMVIILSASKSHYHSKLYLFIEKRFFGNKLSQAICPNNFSDSFMHQNFKYFLQN